MRNFIKPVLPILLVIMVLAGSLLGCAPDANVDESYPGSLGELLDPSGNPFAHSFGDIDDHASRHENAGDDEINVGGLSGLLADDQHVLDAEVLAVAADLDHSADHENAGSDEINVAGLSGLLADDQHVLDAEALAAAVAGLVSGTPSDGQAVQWVDADTIEGAFSGHVVVIAATDSSAFAKVFAVASGGALCSGGDDEVEAQAAIDAAAAGVYWRVHFAAGTYQIDSSDLDVKCLITGEGAIYEGATRGTVFQVAAGLSINLTSPGNTKDILFAFDQVQAADYALKVECAGADDDYRMSNLLEGCTIAQWGGVDQGTGVWIHASSAAGTNAITLSHFGPFRVTGGLAVGVHIEAEEAGGSGYINGVTFDYIYTSDCTTHIWIEANAGADVSQNHFTSIQMQWVGGNTRGIYLTGAGASWNICNQVSAWDWGGGTAVDVAASAGGFNRFVGRIDDWTDPDDFAIIGNFNIPSNNLMLLPKAGWPATTAGCTDTGGVGLVEYGANDIDIYYFDFATGNDEWAQWTIVQPYDANYGTKFKARFIWLSAAGAGDVQWIIKMTGWDDDEAIDKAWGTSQVVVDTRVANDRIMRSDWTPAITPSGWSKRGYPLQIASGRNGLHANDTHSGTIRLIAIEIRYNIGE